MKLTTNQYLMIGAAGAVLLYFVLNNSKKVGETIGAGTVGLADGVISGAIKGLGSVVGIPDTDAQLCTIAKNNGDMLDASLYCTASDFIKWNLSGQPKGN